MTTRQTVTVVIPPNVQAIISNAWRADIAASGHVTLHASGGKIWKALLTESDLTRCREDWFELVATVKRFGAVESVK